MVFRWSLPAAFVCCFALTVSAQPVTKAAPAKSDAALIARGKYIVERVSTCQDCHSARDQHGQFVKDKWLQGAPLLFKPTVPMPAWADFAPPIAGLRGWKEADGVKFLMTGVDGTGTKRRPPMPEYRFNRSDAIAIVKYLKSLNTAAAAK